MKVYVCIMTNLNSIAQNIYSLESLIIYKLFPTSSEFIQYFNTITNPEFFHSMVILEKKNFCTILIMELTH